MASALVFLEGGPLAGRWQSDLAQAGLEVLGVVEAIDHLEDQVAHHAPDWVVASVHAPSDALFRCMQTLTSTSTCPVLLLADEASADGAVAAVEAGVHLFVVEGYDPRHWPFWLASAGARAAHEQAKRQTLLELTARLEERKAVERAKGLLMQARHVSDDEAFRILRTVSMHANQRLGQVSQHIIHSAHFAESVNRAGQLRMLSQRMAKLYVLQLAGLDPKRYPDAMSDSVQRVDAHLLWLSRKIPASFEPVLAQLQSCWQLMRPVLQAPAQPQHWTQLNALAEHLLSLAEQLTADLETMGNVAPLHILNIAGRQRMLSQRYAKLAVLLLLGTADEASALADPMTEVRASFEKSLSHLQGVPLSTPHIHEGLETAALSWRQMLHAATRSLGSGSGALAERVERLALASETLLQVFDDLSTQYERSLDMLVG
ncbi:MAG TPA: type IV pili methyl-accepting chemotaxis transducer N-terminal domain-containing protein [Macromonas sp.]|nr:type IV pili methyl-accepting chemotaxis transducer N-terminal domain-containing protein [Macromonas sp.]